MLVEYLQTGNLYNKHVYIINITYNLLIIVIEYKICIDYYVQLSIGRPVRMEDVYVQEISVEESCNDENIPKRAKPMHSILEEIVVDKRLKQESDNIKHKEKMSRLDRFNDCLYSMSQSLSDIAATKRAKLERGDR